MPASSYRTDASDADDDGTSKGKSVAERDRGGTGNRLCEEEEEEDAWGKRTKVPRSLGRFAMRFKSCHTPPVARLSQITARSSSSSHAEPLGKSSDSFGSAGDPLFAFQRAWNRLASEAKSFFKIKFRAAMIIRLPTFITINVKLN